MFNKYDVIRFAVLVFGLVKIYSVIGPVCGIEQVVVSLASLQ